MEEWKVISEFPNYKVSNTGKVMNIKRNRLLKSGVSGNQVEYVVLYSGNVQHTRSVAKLVAHAFLPGLTEYHKVVHIDGNSLNNRLSNLTVARGVHSQTTVGKHGVKVYCANLGTVYPTITECCEALNIKNKGLSDLIKRGEPIDGVWELKFI